MFFKHVLSKIHNYLKTYKEIALNYKESFNYNQELLNQTKGSIYDPLLHMHAIAQRSQMDFYETRNC